MTIEEIEARILVCEMRKNEYLEVDKTKTAKRYENEIYKWNKLLKRLNPKMEEELRTYCMGYHHLKIGLNNIEKYIQKLIKENEDLIDKLDGTGSFRISNAQSKIRDLKAILKELKKVDD